MNPRILILCCALAVQTVSAQVTPSIIAPSILATEAARLPYQVVLRALKTASSEPLTLALAELPGIKSVEVSAGDKRRVNITTQAGKYLSRTQVATIVQAQGLELESFEVPQWARLRLYVVEASGGA